MPRFALPAASGGCRPPRCRVASNGVHRWLLLPDAVSCVAVVRPVLGSDTTATARDYCYSTDLRTASYDGERVGRVQVSPRQSEVFVDGYFAGTADDFDGVFQRLNIEPGEHEIVIYLEGHRPFSQRFYLQPGKSFNIKHTMEPLGPGEAAPPRPQNAPLPGRGARPRGQAGLLADARGPAAARGTGGGRGRAGGPAPAEGFGSLALRVQPTDAQVLIDGEVWQGSLDGERLVIQLGAGMHHVEIERRISQLPDGHHRRQWTNPNAERGAQQAVASGKVATFE